MKDDGHIGVTYPEMKGARKGLIGVFVSILAGLAVLFGGIWILLTIVFFQNFHLPNLWHCFVLLYTLVTPVLSVAGFLLFWFRPSAKTAILSVSASLAVGGIFLLWIADGSRGLIH